MLVKLIVILDEKTVILVAPTGRQAWLFLHASHSFRKKKIYIYTYMLQNCVKAKIQQDQTMCYVPKCKKKVFLGLKSL